MMARRMGMRCMGWPDGNEIAEIVARMSEATCGDNNYFSSQRPGFRFARPGYAVGRNKRSALRRCQGHDRAPLCAFVARQSRDASRKEWRNALRLLRPTGYACFARATVATHPPIAYA